MTTPIDLRSDTVTKPTDQMRRAMFEAAVGDDVYGEDPTVNELERLAARMVGKEAALFVPTGTQGNQAAVMAHTSRGDEVILEAYSHIFYYEVAGLAAIAGCQARTLNGVRGALDPDEVLAAIRPVNVHFPRTSLICLENTHNASGGCVLPQENVEAISAIAHERGIAVHLDGARLFNAAVASGKSAAELVAPVDSVMFCLSKGLAAPIGSILAGSHDMIARARRARKVLGGGMRQAGILAAAGIVALQQMVDRLAEDHANARLLAERLAEVDGVAVNLDEVQTNMVRIAPTDARWTAAQLNAALDRAGVLCNSYMTYVRFVTHKDVSREQMLEAADRIARVIKAGP